MPKATIDKKSDFLAGPAEIRFAREGVFSSPPAEAVFPKEGGHFSFRTYIAGRLHGGHISRAGRFVDYIDHGSFAPKNNIEFDGTIYGIAFIK